MKKGKNIVASVILLVIAFTLGCMQALYYSENVSAGEPIFEYSALTIEKELDATTNSNEEFTFVIRDKLEPEVIDIGGGDFIILSHGTCGFENEDGRPVQELSLSIKAGEEKQLNVIKGCSFELTEEEKEGWELVSIDGDLTKKRAEGIVNEDTTVTFLNKTINEEPEPIPTPTPKEEEPQKKVLKEAQTIINPPTGKKKVLPFVIMAGSAFILAFGLLGLRRFKKN